MRPVVQGLNVSGPVVHGLLVHGLNVSGPVVHGLVVHGLNVNEPIVQSSLCRGASSPAAISPWASRASCQRIDVHVLS